MQKQIKITDFDSVKDYLDMRTKNEPCLYIDDDGMISIVGYAKFGNLHGMDKNAVFQLFYDLREYLKQSTIYDKNGEEIKV